MSRQLSRIRNLVSEIDEIQRQGQLKARAHPLAAIDPIQDLPAMPLSAPRVDPIPGRITLSLKHNVVVELQVENGSETAGEIVEIKKASHGLEILFGDGKAFHIPFKDVA